MASLVTLRASGAGRTAGRSTDVGIGDARSTGASFWIASGGGVSPMPLSNFAAMAAVPSGRAVCCVDEEAWRIGEARLRVGEVGASGATAVPRVFSHDGGFCEALTVVGRRFA